MLILVQFKKMIMRYFTLLSLCFLLIQCVTTRNTRFIAATTQVDVSFPDSITKIKVLNRTRPLSRGIVQTISDDQGLSFVDRDGVRQTINAFRSQIRTNKFYEVDYTNKTAKVEQSAAFPSPLSIDEIMEVYSGQDFVLASLEIFQVQENDSYITEQKMQLDPNGNEYYITIIKGTRMLTAASGWRLYNSQTGEVLDEFVLDHEHFYEVEGVDQINAKVKLKERRNEAYNSLGFLLGSTYANHISPVAHYVGRSYYSKSKSCPELKLATTFIKTDDWETAKAIWEDGLKANSVEEDLAKLHYNIGVYYERAGNLDQAISELELSKKLDSKIGKSYLDVLKGVKQNGYNILVAQ